MFPQRLKELREEHQFTQEYIGKVLNVSSKTIGAWERGTRQPSIQAIKQLSDLFDVTSDYLLGNTVSPQGHAPEWANEKDKHDLRSFLDLNANSMTYEGEDLTDEEKQQLRVALETIFWKRHKHQ